MTLIQNILHLGDLERLQRFWLQGACKPKAKKRNVSKPLDVNQFMSAFLLLGTGILFTILVLFMEHIYFKYIRKHLAKSDKGGYLTLISLVRIISSVKFCKMLRDIMINFYLFITIIYLTLNSRGYITVIISLLSQIKG